LPVSKIVLQGAEKRFTAVVLKVFFTSPLTNPNIVNSSFTKVTKKLQKFHTRPTWTWFHVSFEDLSQGKIKTLQKNNFTKEQLKEIAKKSKNHDTKRIYKQILCVE